MLTLLAWSIIDTVAATATFDFCHLMIIDRNPFLISSMPQQKNEIIIISTFSWLSSLLDLDDDDFIAN